MRIDGSRPPGGPEHGPACSRDDHSLPVVSLAGTGGAASQTGPSAPLLAVAWVWAVRRGGLEVIGYDGDTLGPS